jgi:hypothetical protein
MTPVSNLWLATHHFTGRTEHLYKGHIPCRSVAYKHHEIDTMKPSCIVDVVFGYQFLLGSADRFSSDQSAHEFFECSIGTVLCPYLNVDSDQTLSLGNLVSRLSALFFIKTTRPGLIFAYSHTVSNPCSSVVYITSFTCLSLISRRFFLTIKSLVE